MGILNYGAEQQTSGGGILSYGMDSAPSTPMNQEKTIGDIVSGIGSTLMSPASAALDAISYLDKPRGAIAGATQYLTGNSNDENIGQAAIRGWKDNTSYKEAFSPEWVKENPVKAALAGFATDVVLDPMWLLPPAKIAQGIKAGSKAVGLTDALINPAVKAVEGSRTGKGILAFGQDALGYNRVADPIAEFKAGRATDQVVGQDTIDEINKFTKTNPNADVTGILKYVEAKSPDALTTTTIPSERAGIVAAAEDGSLAKSIREGVVTKDQAFNVLREEGKTIPDYLLQEHQRVAQTAQQAIPDYIMRNDVLNAIPDVNIRNQIQSIGDKIIESNKARSESLLNTGRLSNEQFVHFMEGSHLRRSFSQYETPEKFLEAVRKNGTPEEWQRVYSDYQTAQKQAQGFGAAHKVNMKDFAGRQVLSDETLAKMGAINDPAYKVMDTFNRGSKTLREDEFLSKITQMFGKSEQEAAMLSRDLPKSREYVHIADSKSFGELAGKWVPRDVANQVMGALGQKPDKINETLAKAVSWWKVGKLANPASIMRNFYSGIPMANVFGKVPLQAMPKYMAKVADAFLTQGGKNAPLIRELRSTGVLGDIWSKQELGNILTGKEWSQAKEAYKAGNIASAAGNTVKAGANFGMDAFGAPDLFSRAVVFAYHRDHGMSVKEAAKFTNKAQFDYSSAPEWVNWLSRTGVMPFAKFPYFAGKETVEALWNNPAQVTKYTKAQNQVNTNDREKIMPDYLKAKTLLPTGETTRIVNGKEQKVQGNIDLSYVLPFVNDVNVGNPLLDMLQIARTGKNSLGMDVIKPGMTGNEKATAYGKAAFGSIAPSVVAPYSLEKIYNATQGNVDSKGRQYDLTDALLQTVGGVKNVPINTDEMYQQKIGLLKRQIKETDGLIQQAAKDQSLNHEQKRERISEYVRQVKNLSIDIQQTNQAYQREKKRGAI